MGSNKVYFASLRTSYRKNLLDKVAELLDSIDLSTIVRPRTLVAVKIHFGEKGNTAYIRPIFLRRIVDCVRALGALPFLTDTNTLYAGSRKNGISHYQTAMENGFAYAVVNAPVVIADGIRGGSFVEVRVDREIIQSAYIAKEIFDADVLISVAHFKGHEFAGFGGTIKNLGMGCASRKGKLIQHSGLSPRVKKKACAGCGDCILRCAHQAISLRDDKAAIDSRACAGCGECIVICPRGAIHVKWTSDIPVFQKKMVEYAYAALRDKQGRSVFLNFLTQISPGCDCSHYNDAPIIQDLGFMASLDPVAIEQASVDMVNSQRSLDNSCLATATTCEDKFRALYPRTDWTIQLEHAEKIGLGRRDYELVRL
jgi:uncharacterized Fe-S center protein